MSSQKGDKGRDHEETETLTSGNALKGQGCEEAGCKTTKEGPVIKTFINEDGTTSSYFDKRRLKIAPRSTLQFKVGPPFDVISNYCCVKDSSTGEELDLSLAPRIDRGFDYINGEWIGYKRNYFTLVCSFGVHNMGTHEFLNGSFSVTMLEGQRLSLTIRYFAVRLVAACDEDKSEINLVQHTAKRDKGPQFAPPIHALIPSELPNHQTIREASNVRNEAKMKKYDSLFFLHRQRVKSDYSPNSLLCTYPDDSIKKVARYERVQFSSSINAKKPSQQNKHFKLRVVLGCVVKGIHVAKSENGVYRGLDCIVDGGSSTFVPIMEMETPPLIIRGRSPSNYSCPVKAPEPTQGVNNHRENHTVTDCAKLNSNLTVDTADDVTSSTVREKQLNKSVRKTRKTPNPKQIAPDVATEDDTISMDGEDQFVSLQTMSYIEAVIIKNLPLVLRSTVNGKDIEGCPKASGHTIPAVGMKDIELGSIMRMSPQGLYDHDFLTSFRDDPFNDAVIDAYPHYHQPDPLSASKFSVKNKKRKLNNKMTLNDDHIVYRSPSQNVKESSEDSVEYLTLENSYNYPLQVTSRGHDAMSIPRSLGLNPMDISFCLNVDSETTVLPRPISSARLSSRRLLTATAKPSDVFGDHLYMNFVAFTTVSASEVKVTEYKACHRLLFKLQTMHDGPGKVNKAVNFVQEGHSDLTSQGKTEEDEQMRLEVDSKRKERKSLQEQLKENAAMKQEEFNLLVKEKNSFNRLSEEDIDFYRKLNSKSKLDHQQMEKYLIRNMKQFEERKAQVLQDDGLQENHGIDTVEITKNVIVKKMKSRQRLKGVIKKKKSSGGAKPT